jgi:uncharacterized protein (DUF1697 family)
MAIVVLLRGVNVGGHRTFRPTQLVARLREFDVVNIGAAGTFVARRATSRRKLREALLRALPLTTDIVFCDGSTIRRLGTDNPFGPKPPAAGVTRFVSFLATPRGAQPVVPIVPISLPTSRDWLVRIVGTRDGLLFGEYRRHMKTIGYLGQLDKLFGGRLTTRNWGTIGRILDVLNA